MGYLKTRLRGTQNIYGIQKLLRMQYHPCMGMAGEMLRVESFYQQARDRAEKPNLHPVYTYTDESC